jgi:hypothetical protein
MTSSDVSCTSATGRSQRRLRSTRTAAVGRLPKAPNGCFVAAKRETAGLSVGQLWRNLTGGFGSRWSVHLRRKQPFARRCPPGRNRAPGLDGPAVVRDGVRRTTGNGGESDVGPARSSLRIRRSAAIRVPQNRAMVKASQLEDEQLLKQFVRAYQQRLRDAQAERLRGGQIDREDETRVLFDGLIAGFGTSQHARQLIGGEARVR